MIFSRITLDVFGLKVDRRINGNEITQLAIVLKMFSEVNVRFTTRGTTSATRVVSTPGAVALDPVCGLDGLLDEFVMGYQSFARTERNGAEFYGAVSHLQSLICCRVFCSWWRGRGPANVGQAPPRHALERCKTLCRSRRAWCRTRSAMLQQPLCASTQAGPTAPGRIHTYFFMFFATNSWIFLPCAANPPAVLNWMISAPSFDLKLCGAGM
jgi:hypothetical protein